MQSENEIFFEHHGYNRDEVIRQFIIDFGHKYPYINVQAIPFETVKEFLHQPYVVKVGTEKKMDLLQDYILANGLCEVTP